MISRIEALADAISHYSEFADPTSPAYRNRNPGALRAFRKTHKHDGTGLRTFDHLADGYTALLWDLERKCSEPSRSGLTPESPLQELLWSLHMPQPEGTPYFVARFLRNALCCDTVTPTTPLKWFLEN